MWVGYDSYRTLTPPYTARKERRPITDFRLHSKLVDIANRLLNMELPSERYYGGNYDEYEYYLKEIHTLLDRLSPRTELFALLLERERIQWLIKYIERS